MDGVPLESGQVAVLCCGNRAEADGAREAEPDVAWQVVGLYRPGDEIEYARGPVLWLDTSRIDPPTAARAIDHADLMVWYEVINPTRVITTDGGPAADDYSNLMIFVPDGHRVVAHAVRGAAAPECLPSTAGKVMRSGDLWVLARLQDIDECEDCVLRHG